MTISMACSGLPGVSGRSKRRPAPMPRETPPGTRQGRSPRLHRSDCPRRLDRGRRQAPAVGPVNWISWADRAHLSRGAPRRPASSTISFAFPRSPMSAGAGRRPRTCSPRVPCLMGRALRRVVEVRRRCRVGPQSPRLGFSAAYARSNGEPSGPPRSPRALAARRTTGGAFDRRRPRGWRHAARRSARGLVPPTGTARRLLNDPRLPRASDRARVILLSSPSGPSPSPSSCACSPEESPRGRRP
jgi:hypothetical protein